MLPFQWLVLTPRDSSRSTPAPRRAHVVGIPIPGRLRRHPTPAGGRASRWGQRALRAAVRLRWVRQCPESRTTLRPRRAYPPGEGRARRSKRTRAWVTSVGRSGCTACESGGFATSSDAATATPAHGSVVKGRIDRPYSTATATTHFRDRTQGRSGANRETRSTVTGILPLRKARHGSRTRCSIRLNGKSGRAASVSASPASSALP